MKKIWNTLTAAALLVGTLISSLAVPEGASASAAAPAAGCRTDDHGLKLVAMKDTGNAHMQAIQFLGANIGRAAGNGFMIGTSDGGCHWQSIYNTGKLSFNQMQFLTNSVGYVLAKTSAEKQNTLLKTTNGGTSYTWVPTGQYGFERIQFLSENVGYGFTRQFTFKTTNGGKNWTKVATPPNTRYVQFMSQDKAWAIVVKATGGYEVVKSVDGGNSWVNSLAVKASVNYGGAIYGTDSSDVWVVLYGDSGMSQTSYSLFHTTDAGAHWKQIISNTTAGGGPAPGPAIPVGKLPGPAGRPTDMAVIGHSAAYMAAGSGALDQVQFGRSVDDGKTWKNLPSGVPGYEAKLSFVSPASGYMAVTSESQSGIYKTINNGTKWTKLFGLPESN
ncbi:WD40/YVTN/BNR-like repeat-containing protein [Paenibacillus albus]|uniref:Photosynthesis system II assembly factor Ycf48/Hcf136-like domain-containing protein n=1 Tax=Paenibacillus albus TaxID=2495582 RepID=A0A3S9A0J3_9BACL|nr:hypothetical protein [Paenibacillus albus]AZN39283.1 hypothetical protein EJC50_06100 [Paenibacillus albus]